MGNMEYEELTNLSIVHFSYDELTDNEKYGGSSYYLFDLLKLKDNVMNLRKTFGPGILISYSVKANPWLAEFVREYVDYLEICSPGELRNGMLGGWDLSKVTLEGVLKTKEEIDAALQKGIGRISIDSFSQWEMVRECAEKLNRKTNILLRLSSGNQFGMEQEEIFDIIENNSENPLLVIDGLHYYLGTQRKSAEEIRKVFCRLEEFLDKLQMRTGRQFRVFELGGGAPVPYFLEDDTEKYREAYETLGVCVKKLSERIPVIYEAGRILAASAGCYISKIIDCKSRDSGKIVIIEGGTHQLAYYGSLAGGKTPKITCISQDNNPDTEESVTICGSLCTAQDIMARRVKLRRADSGTYLIFGLAGAYSVTECGSDFLSRSKPAILIRKNDNMIEALRTPEKIDFIHI